jgi:hypothetical protein
MLHEAELFFLSKIMHHTKTLIRNILKGKAIPVTGREGA